MRHAKKTSDSNFLHLWNNEISNDDVAYVNENFGLCKVRYDHKKNYCDTDGNVRTSAFIEWVAQSYAYSSHCQNQEFSNQEKKNPEKAFLVALRNFEIVKSPERNENYFIQSMRTHQFGPIDLVQGKIFSESGELLAHGQIRVFAN